MSIILNILAGSFALAIASSLSMYPAMAASAIELSMVCIPIALPVSI